MSTNGQRQAPRPRPMFGGGTPLASMPVYRPVTRAPEPAPQEYRQERAPAYHPDLQGHYAEFSARSQAASAHPGQHQEAAYRPAPEPQAYATPQNSQAYAEHHPAQGQNGHGGYAQAHPQNGFEAQNGAYGQPEAYQPEAYQPEAYQPEAYQPDAYQPDAYAGVQNGFETFDEPLELDEPLDLEMEAPLPDGDQGYQALPAPAGYAPQDYAGNSYAPQNHAPQDYARQDFPPQDYAPQDLAQQQDYAQQEYGQQGYAGQDYAGQDYAQPEAYTAPQPAPPQPLDPQRSLQAFDAPYDQHPEIALGFNAPRQQAPRQQADAAFPGDASFPGGEAAPAYQQPQADADFFGGPETQMPPPQAEPAARVSSRYRSLFVVGSALVGAIALGGALAFAYKQSGGGMASGEPPVITADGGAVKEAPAEPGGREFPHQNKQIYERLQGGETQENERLTPRQEEIALPNLPGGEEAGSQAVSVTMPGQTGAGAMPDAAGPHRVKTLVVRPDGTVVSPEAEGAPDQQMAAAEGTPATTGAIAQAAEPQAAPAAPAAPQQQVAAAAATAAAPAAAPAAAAAPSKFVVQVAAKRDQTEALAAFADMQQKYPSLLGDHRPLVQRADLGDKGVWYRLRVGPMEEKAAAYRLCEQLKAQGHRDCLVMAN